MSKDKEWNPLNDVWDSYNESIRKSRPKNIFDMEEEEMDEIIWPEDLYIGDTELEDAKQFVIERTNEILKFISYYKAVHPEMISSYILRSLVSGMLWEKQRIG